MEIVSALMMASNTFERFIDSLTSFMLFGSIPILFIVFLILFIIQVVKVKKQGARKVKAVVFGCISGYFLVMLIGEIALMLLLAAAIAHM